MPAGMSSANVSIIPLEVPASGMWFLLFGSLILSLVSYCYCNQCKICSDDSMLMFEPLSAKRIIVFCKVLRLHLMEGKPDHCFL